jgi:hypothetical protein
MEYREFKLRVPIWDISDAADGDSAAMRSLFRQLSVTPPDRSLASLYDSFYDYSAAQYSGDPHGRIGRGDVLIFVSDADDLSFIAIDMFDEASDQMNTVGIKICAPDVCGDEIARILESIKSTAEVSSALLQGSLGLQESLSIQNFPRLVQSHDTEVLQHAQVFRGGRLIQTTKLT